MKLETVSVAPPGPPDVVVMTISASFSLKMMRSMIAVTLTGGDAVVLTYQVNSEPNAVTGKQYRLEVVRFDFYQGGEEADLILSGPVGSDNVDPWRLVSQSFQWV